MNLYHGSGTPDLTLLKPFVSNHSKSYVYLSNSATLALLYAHNPIKRPGGFFTYWFDKERTLHYDEYFPDQTRLLYAGQAGWVYTVDTEDLPQLDTMPWVYLSEAPVAVAHAKYIPDLYIALLQAEATGQLCIHRYDDIPEARRATHQQIVRNSLKEHDEDDYRRFVRQYMPQALDA